MTIKKTLYHFLLLTLLLAGCRPAQAAPAPTPVIQHPSQPANQPPGLPFSQSGVTALPGLSMSALTPTPQQTPTISSTPTLTATARTATPTPHYVTVTIPAGRAVVPILMYHHISDEASTRYTLSVQTFRAQMKYLQANGYQTISISRLAEIIRRGGALPLKPVVLTFDDGYLDVYKNAFPIMQELGFSGVAYIITGTLGTKLSYGYMQVSDLKELVAAGWEIGSHSISHHDLMKSKIGVGNEIQKSKTELEEKLGIQVRSFSYPFGAANQSIKDLVADQGYEAGVGIDITITHTPRRLYYLSRREVERGLTLEQFRALLQPGEADQYVDLQLTGTPTPNP